MKKIAMVFWGCLLFFVSCDKSSQKNAERDADFLALLKDSTNVFRNIQEIEVNGELYDSNIILHFYSIPEEVFFTAVNRNNEHIRYFNRNIKLNEKREIGLGARDGAVLKIGCEHNYVYLVDILENRRHRARNFYFEDRIGLYYIIKRIQFEDAETVFWNSVTGEEDLYLLGTSVYTNTKDSLIFYSNTLKVTLEDKNPVCLLKVNPSSIDTLLCVDTEWFTEFAFFDKEESSIYYIHCFYEDYVLKSTYARLDFSLLHNE